MNRIINGHEQDEKIRNRCKECGRGTLESFEYCIMEETECIRTPVCPSTCSESVTKWRCRKCGAVVSE